MVDLSKNHDPLFVIEWTKTNKIKVLNVAGPRESKTAGIHDMAIEFFGKYLNCEFLRGEVVHEIAHVFLEHDLRKNPDNIEDEADQTARNWGFDAEIKA